LLLLLWEFGNIDAQVIATIERALNNYCSGYLTKGEKNHTQELWQDCNKNKTLFGKLKSLAMKLFKTREMGIFEVVDRLLGFALHQFSDTIQFLNATPTEHRWSRLKNFDLVNNLPEEEQNLYHTNMLDNYYPNRPDVLAHLCLYDFIGYYEFKSKPCSHYGTINSLCFQLKNDLGYICKRRKMKVIKIRHIKPVDKNSTEDYFHQMLMCFKPWTKESELSDGCPSFHEAFQKALSNNLLSNQFDDYRSNRVKVDQAREISNRIIEKIKNSCFNEEDIDEDIDQFIQVVQLENNNAF